MLHALLSELLSNPAELSVMLGSFVFFVSSVALALSGRTCGSCGRICIATGDSTQFQQIMGHWIRNRYHIQVCGGLDCPAPLQVQVKTRKATKAELLELDER